MDALYVLQYENPESVFVKALANLLKQKDPKIQWRYQDWSFYPLCDSPEASRLGLEAGQQLQLQSAGRKGDLDWAGSSTYPSAHGLTKLQGGLGNIVFSWGAVPRYNLELALLNMGRMNIGGQVTSDIVPKLNFPSELSLLSPLVPSSFPSLPYFFLSLPFYLPSFLPLTLLSSSSSLLSPSFLLYFPSSLPPSFPPLLININATLITYRYFPRSWVKHPWTKILKF